MNKIIYGDQTFIESDILSGHYVMQHSKAGESLAIDTLDFTILYVSEAGFITADGERFITSDNEKFFVLRGIPLTDFIPGSPLFFYQEDKLINKFYLSDVKRLSRDTYRFESESVIGILDKSIHPGGIYEGEPITNVLDEIFEGIEYEIDPVVQNIKLYGWLPYATKRENLQQITIATALSIKKTINGNPKVTALTPDIRGAFGADKSLLGSKVEVGTPCTFLQVTEHQFIPSEDGMILCQEMFFDTKLVLFPEPAHSLAIYNGEILESTSNHALVKGWGNVLLNGEKYIHTISQVTEGTFVGGSKDNVLQIKDATLITPLNSTAVVKKLFEVYSKPTKIIPTVIRNNELPGDVVEVLNPYTDEMTKGLLLKMSTDITKSPLTEIEVLVDYLPTGAITGYENRILINENGIWQVPEDVTEIRVTIIGGGAGGNGGKKGDRGLFGGEGGDYGAGGTGGKIFNVVLNVNPQQSFNCTIGQGGLGGAMGLAGTEGTNSTFGNFTSADGAPSPDFTDIYNGEALARPGNIGKYGGRGHSKNMVGNEVNGHVPGQNGQTASMNIDGFTIYGYGGYGGGASDIADGEPGTDGRVSYNKGNGMAEGGDGGNGADGGDGADATVFGSGGTGGSGGGGGGNRGGARGTSSQYEWDGADGLGGNGGSGGNGANGCIIIYY